MEVHLPPAALDCKTDHALICVKTLDSEPATQETQMGINKASDIAANLQIGPTTLGMVRLYIEAEGIDLPLDFDPEEAEEIADELRAAAARARVMAKG
jgi:hypothetical protein